jgi:glycosyltransferase involved in cell wall biosynthesis
VAITTFNSANWLSRALDSVLGQEVDFPFEIVVGDDCSQDTTVDIALSYQARQPNLIRVLERTRNIGMQRNYYDTFEQCRGQFIAWLDADDYWTDPKKLAIQANTLIADTTAAACCHYVRWVTSDQQVQRDRYPTIPAGRYGLAEILQHNFVPSPSVMFRNGIHRTLPPWYFDLAPTTDWPIWVLSAISGDIVLLDRVMADYMLTPNSAYWSKGNLHWHEMDARFYEHVESILPAKWHRLSKIEKCKRYEAIAYWTRKQGNYTSSRQAALKAFRAPFWMDRLGSKTKSLFAAVAREIEWRLKGKRAMG